ncbi:virulence factor, partial [bacterium]|nr:virulence factor [bacterium]
MEPTDAPRRRRRAKTDEIVTIYWRDIPAQVTATTDGNKGSWLLEERFQVAIDRAAAVAGLT